MRNAECGIGPLRVGVPRGAREGVLSAFRFPVSGFLLFLLFPTLASAITDPRLFPDARESTTLRSNERNPFTAQQVVQESQTPAVPEAASEESRLRRILQAVKIGGVSGGNGKFQALLGSLIIKPGDSLPPLISNQFEELRVTSVDPSSITLSFFERDSTANPRQIVLPVGIKPDVSQFLYGEAVEELTQIDPQRGRTAPLPQVENPAVTQTLKGSQDVDLKNLTDRAVKLMGVLHDAKKSEKEQ